MIQQVSLDDALEAAGTGSKWPTLVYATEKALETTPTPLSDSLRVSDTISVILSYLTNSHTAVDVR